MNLAAINHIYREVYKYGATIKWLGDSRYYLVCPDGRKFWYLNGELHREDGPTCEYPNGSKEWYIDGKRHRIDGPAYEHTNGDNCWYLNGKLHRTDGPAVEYADGDKWWFLNGKELTEEEWKKKI